jgi:hypothetical protein
MLHAPTKPVTKDLAIDKKQFFTFWDMDDTCIFWEVNDGREIVKIKNPHLLLPVMLFQTFARNQHFGIMTNRPPTDDIVEYTVKMLRDEIHDFGIDIPDSQVIYCGGENSNVRNKELHILENALASLPQQLQSLKLIENGGDFVQQANSMQKLLLSVNSRKYDGKNYFLINFLNQHYFEDLHSYAFPKGTCPKGDLILGIVDDIGNIAKAAEQLGTGYFGVQASRGGNAPRENSTQEDIYDYYRVDYFHKLASIIGLSDYCESLLSSPENHKHDHPMLQIAALLFIWQKSNTKSIKKQIKEVEKQLSELQCEQIAKMLGYIIERKISHPHAQYKSVDELIAIFSPKADRYFLNTVAEQCSTIEYRISELTQVRPTDEPMLERSKSKTLSNLFKRPSTGKAQAAIASPNLSSETIKLVKVLELKKNALIERLKHLTTSGQADIAELASLKLKMIAFKSKEETIVSYAPTRSLSARVSATATTASSSSSSSTSISAIDTQRRSYTPAADNSSNKLRTVSSSSSLEELVVIAPPKKIGSNIN